MIREGYSEDSVLKLTAEQLKKKKKTELDKPGFFLKQLDKNYLGICLKSRISRLLLLEILMQYSQWRAEM